MFISRKNGESVIINNDIELTVLEVRGKTVKLGFTFPKTASVLRKELHERIMQENLAAAKTGTGADFTSAVAGFGAGAKEKVDG